MKLTEKDLMLGDLIYQERAEGKVVVKMLPHWFNPPYEFSDVFSPIPLTPEILEKNGFVKINSQRYDFGEYESNCFIKVNPKRGWIHVNGKNANCNLYSHKYVHELQHALRLCGLTELADSFKVI